MFTFLVDAEQALQVIIVKKVKNRHTNDFLRQVA